MSDSATITAPNAATDSNGADTAAATTTAAPATPSVPDWQQWAQGLERLNETMGGKLDTLVNEVRTAAAPVEAAPEPVDLDGMSRQELVTHIVGTIGQAVRDQIAEALNPFAEQLNGLQQNVVTRTVEQEIAQLRSSNKDFDDWKTEMVALAREHPTLPIPRLYKLARAENPAKAGELDKKYNPPAAPARPRFGGFTPSGSTTGGAAPLTAKDAGIAAYQEVAARHPGVLAALENL